MKFQESIYNDVIKVRRNTEIPEIYDVELGNLDRLKSFSSIECHVVLYPYSRKVVTKHYEFTPFEEYVNDITAHQKSAYTPIKNHFGNFFGLLLGILICVIFLIFKPVELFSIESIVSVFGAYFVGKELWGDIEELFIEISSNWRIRYVENYYLYRLEKHTTLSLYSRMAKKRRYGKEAVLPEKMDFIQKRNSQTLRMVFNAPDLASVPEPSAHILSIHFNPKLLEEFKKEGSMFGIKVSFNKRFLGITRCREFFQSTDRDLKGCLNEKGEWTNNALFYRNTFTLGRIKYFMNKGILENKSILDIRLDPILT